MGDSLMLDLGDRTAVVDVEEVRVYETPGYVSRGADDSSLTTTKLIALLAACLDVERVTPSFEFQHLVEWIGADEPIAAFQAATASILDESLELGLYDFALLVDGLSSSGWGYHAEFGVIGADDVAQRLSRRAGQMRDFARPDAVRQQIESDLPVWPTVATFVDSTWHAGGGSTSGVDELEDQLSSAAADANRLVNTLHKRVTMLWG
jgi:hypothetical protein